MIIRETTDAFIMTTQDDHGRFSGEIARGFRPSLFMDESVLDEVLLAIAEHDRAWLRMDDTPIWNDRSGTPYTFIDYPVLPKLLMYSKGVDEIEAMSPYAAYLCSLHFASFMKNAKGAPFVAFYQEEQQRQERLRRAHEFPADDIVQRQFGLLQLCDDISLYVSMNEPGATKEQEHLWFRNGFAMSIEGEKVVAQWISEDEIRLSPVLFDQSWSASVRWKQVLKKEIQQEGLAQAFAAAPWTEQTVIFVS
ncbi:DUF3891 family protein [Paenibacillus sp. JCM 10914]|uniref:DUF3891 family protein n=1 Tax=Paenibacillus sp. JCM 10914 TaxID=1236974 RepID=UPI0003CC8FA5|nr:DUF3891 family protein [Paenibacillus sp. JCM 10914]GAE08659.1 hypothetical protein JCM10914_4975 [Paenibacillus sp. JCM 10914]